jgi:hypothetical protein
VKKTKFFAVVGTGTVTERRVTERLIERLIDTSNDLTMGHPYKEILSFKGPVKQK